MSTRLPQIGSLLLIFACMPVAHAGKAELQAQLDAAKAELAEIAAKTAQVQSDNETCLQERAVREAEAARQAELGKKLRDANEAYATGELETARMLLEEILEEPPARVTTVAQRMLNEVNVVGKDVAVEGIDSWLLGKRLKGFSEPTYVVFWEQWCPHCRREIPKLQGELATWEQRGVEVLTLTKVTRTSTVEKVQSYIEDEALTLRVGHDKDGAMSEMFAVTGIPAAALVVDGKIVWRGHPGRMTEELYGQITGGDQ